MKYLLILSLLVALIAPVIAEEASSGPFGAVAAPNHEAIVVKLRSGGRWALKMGDAEVRITSPGEEITLAIGTTMQLCNKHTRYSIKAVLDPEPGLLVEHEFDATSMGGEVTYRKYFIPAKPPETQEPPKP